MKLPGIEPPTAALETDAALALIVKQAFTPTAASGGFLGAGVMMAIRMGVARGVFSNESGLGSAPIAAAAAQTKHPVTQALVSMTQTFIDTIVVCTMTGLVLILTGAGRGFCAGGDVKHMAELHQRDDTESFRSLVVPEMTVA